MTARDKFLERITGDNLAEVLCNLHLLKWMLKVKRVDLGELYDDVFNLLLQTHQEKTLSLYPSLDDRNRLILTEELLQRAFSERAKALVFNDNYYLIRLLLVEYFRELSEIEQENLTANRAIRGSILGLKDLGLAESNALIEPYLSSGDRKIVDAALWALAEAKSSIADEYVTENVIRNQENRKALFGYLNVKRPEAAIEQLELNFDGLPADLKSWAIRLFSSIGGYGFLKYFLRALHDEEEVVRAKALQAIRAWKRKASVLYTSIDASERRLVMTELDKVRADQYGYSAKVLQEVGELEFYLK